MKPQTRQFAAPKPLPNVKEFRTPPQDMEAEGSVLGAMLLSKQAVLEVRNILAAEDFYREAHRHLYQAIINLDDRNAPIDLTSIYTELKRLGQADTVGGVSALTTLIERVPTSANAEYHASIVSDKAYSRRFINVCTRAISEAYEDTEVSPSRLADKLMGELIKGDVSKKGFLDPQEFSRQLADEVMDGEQVDYIPTGFKQLDEKLGGIRIGHIGVVTGPAEQGKSTFVANVAVNVARMKKPNGEKYKVAHLILEDDAANVAYRQICLLNGVTMDRLKSQDPQVMASGQKLTCYEKWSKLNIWLGDKLTVGCVWDQAKLQILRLIRKRGIDLLLIEGVELFETRFRQGENKADGEARLANELDTISQENKIATWVILGMGKNDEGYKGVGSNAWWKIQRQSIKIKQHKDSKNDSRYENVTVVEIGKTNDRKKWPQPFLFEMVGDTYRWKEIEGNE